MGRINGLYVMLSKPPFIYPSTVKSRTAIAIIEPSNFNFKNTILIITRLYARPSGPHVDPSLSVDAESVQIT